MTETVDTTEATEATEGRSFPKGSSYPLTKRLMPCFRRGFVDQACTICAFEQARTEPAMYLHSAGENSFCDVSMKHWDLFLCVRRALRGVLRRG